jgi:hypothetical protein
MVTMIDEIYDRHYREARADLNASIADSIARLGRAVGNAFSVLNRIEYSSPWTAPAKRARFN